MCGTLKAIFAHTLNYSKEDRHRRRHYRLPLTCDLQDNEFAANGKRSSKQASKQATVYLRGNISYMLIGNMNAGAAPFNSTLCTPFNPGMLERWSNG